MKKIPAILKKPGIKIVLLILVVIVLVVGIWIGRSIGSKKSEKETPVAKAETETQIWTCSMHPQIRLPKPGLCPICNMDLIPLKMDETETDAGMRQLTVSENAKKLMEIEVVPVERKFVETLVRMVGKIDYDETNLSYITAWVPGRLDKLYVDYTGVPVNKGDKLVSLYSPELIGAQEELLQAIEAIKNIKETKLDIMREMTESTANAAREKLSLWGLSPEQITEIETTGHVTDHTTIYSPTSGIVIHKNAVEGMYVQTGTKIYTIADLSKVWVKLDAYESDLQWLRDGQEAEFTAVSYPGQTFKGTISFIDPILNDRTRTVKIRVNVPNPDGKLKPGMFVKAIVRSQGNAPFAEKPLVIPVTAALVTGTRAIVYVQLPDTETPTYEGREIVLGARAGDYYLVQSGLNEGELVVVKGNFKIDSSLQLQAKPSMMSPEGGGGKGMHDHGHEQEDK